MELQDVLTKMEENGIGCRILPQNSGIWIRLEKGDVYSDLVIPKSFTALNDDIILKNLDASLSQLIKKLQ